MRHRTSYIVFVSILAPLLLACAEESLGPRLAADDASAAKGVGVQLAAPSNASAVSSGQSQIDLAWQDNSKDESQFEVHRSTDGPNGAFTLLSSVGANATTYRDGGLTAATQYCYVIRSVRLRASTTTFSPFSAVACAQTDPLPPPPPPPAPDAATAAIARATGSSTVLVRWTAEWSSQTQFRIDRSSDGGALWSSIGTATAYEKSFTDAGVQSERSVCYRVIAFNVTGTAAPSNTDCATPPAAPTDLVVTLVDGQMFELAWTDNSTVEDGYEVWTDTIYSPCCTSGGCDSGTYGGEYLVASLAAGTTTYRTSADLGAGVCGNFLWFEVKATKGDDVSSASRFTVNE